MPRPLAPLLLAALLPGLLTAQPGPRHRGRPMPPGPLVHQMFQLRTTRLRETLGIGEEKARVIAERWARYDQEFIERAHQIQPLKARFAHILRGPGTEEDKDRALRPLLEQYLTLRHQQAELRRRFQDDLKGYFASPAQQARLILLVEEMQQDLREAIRERHKDPEER